ncbi:MAG TPA: hypothetical protein VNZ26_28200 [Vicinamibacterales bacterium]|jgi:hypothetical protein|nr:hypothetical protein [Vicinamibacterales bacterium]
MKKYTTPTLSTSGNVVLETAKDKQPIQENSFHKPLAAGDVGFYL